MCGARAILNKTTASLRLRHLQRSMNRLFAGLRADDPMVWYRHNINPMQADQMTECLTHGVLRDCSLGRCILLAA